MSKVGATAAVGRRPTRARRGGRRRSRPSRRPGSRPRGPRSSSPTRSWPPSRRRRGPRRGSGGRPSEREPACAVASAWSAASSRPTRSRPSWIATVAGIAPASRTAASDAVATSRFCGYGRPWLISVDSRATTGRPSAQGGRRPRALTVEAVGDHQPSGELGTRRRQLPCRGPVTRQRRAPERAGSRLPAAEP